MKQKQSKKSFFDVIKENINWMPMDFHVVAAVLLINMYGVVMIYSASYYFCGKSAECNNDTMYMFKNQLEWIILGLIVMYGISKIDYHVWRRIIILGLIACVAMSLALKIPGIGRTVNGATRWIKIGGFSLQVAEPIKTILIYWMAHYIARYRVDHFINGTLYLTSVAAVAIFLGKMSNNMSVIIIIGLICGAMFFVANPGWIKYFVIVGGAFILAILAVIIIVNIPMDGNEDFRFGRIVAWVYPDKFPDKAFQPQNALFAIGAGGIWGKGLGQSLQKYMIPEPQNDFILAIIAEEMGLIGVIALIGLFIYLLYRILMIVINARDLLGKFLASGVFLHIAIQTVMNVAVVTSAIPTTGVTLPFISAGGTAAFFLLVEIGLVLSVDRYSKQKYAESEARKRAQQEVIYGINKKI